MLCDDSDVATRIYRVSLIDVASDICSVRHFSLPLFLFCDGVSRSKLYRYDARLLLESLPDVSASPVSPDPASPGGWSDLPSDAEDTFFFSAEEAEDYRRDKRRRVIDRDREARLTALRAKMGRTRTQILVSSGEAATRR